MLAWPSISCTARKSPEDCSTCEAKEWRSMCGWTCRAKPRLIAHAASRDSIARTPIRRPDRVTNIASASETGSPARTESHARIASRAGPPTGTMRSLEPLPHTRTSPVARSMPPTSSPASSERRNPDEYASSKSARSRTASGSSPSIATRRPLRRARAPRAAGHLRRLEARAGVILTVGSRSSANGRTPATRTGSAPGCVPRARARAGRPGTGAASPPAAR